MVDIGKEYGTALFMLACEENAADEYAEAIRMINGVFSENGEYLDMLSSPTIPRSERLAVIESVFGGRVPENIISFLQLLCEKSRLGCYKEAAEEFEKLIAASKCRSAAKVISAVELSNDEKARLTEKLERTYNVKVDAEYSVDKELLGGFIVEIDGKVIDGSLRSRLREFKEVMRT